MSSTGKINYARDVFGIRSVAAASIFAAVYGLLLPYYLWRAVRNPTYVLIILALFCASESSDFHRDPRGLTVHTLSPSDCVRNAGGTRGFRRRGK